MVGTVGAVTMPAIGRASDAVDNAFSIIRGWSEEDRRPIQGWLEELREAIEKNQEVYDEASAALNAASALEKSLRELKRQADTSLRAAEIRTRDAAAYAATTESELEAAQAGHAENVNAFELDVKERNRLLAERDSELRLREDEVTVGKAVLGRRMAEATRALADAAAARTKTEETVTDMRAVLDKHGS